MRNVRNTALVALMACMAFIGTAFAQDAPKPPAPSTQAKEKLMIYDGEFLKVQLYGFVKLDVVSNSNDVVSESGPLAVVNDRYYFNATTAGFPFIVPTTPTDNYTPFIHFKKNPSARNGSLVFDARTSRLGIKISGPESKWGNTSAAVEADFWGGHPSSGTPSRQGLVRMRHAYGRVDWSSGTSLLVGQYWTVNMPIYALASTATFIPWGANGLLFMREPQIAVMQKLGVDRYNVLIEASIARVQAGNDTAGTLYPGPTGVQLDDRGAGEASKIPGFRGRVSFNMKPIDLIAVTLGAMGHYQFEKQQMDYTRLGLYLGTAIPAATAPFVRVGKMVNSYSYGAFTKIQISLVSLVASGFMGWNMDTFLSGLGEGAVVNAAGTKLVPVHTKGGYAQLKVDLRKVSPIPIELAGGIGGEFKQNNRLIANGKQLYNKTISGTFTFHLNQYTCFMFEVAKHETKYKGVLGSAENMRYHGSAAVNF